MRLLPVLRIFYNPQFLGPAVYQASSYVGPIIFLLLIFSVDIPTYICMIIYIYIYVKCFFFKVKSKFAIVFIFVLCYTSIISFVNLFEKYEN